ncbi:MAG: branched-chain amino acid ABC transporter permease [Myxococcales bacterium]
MAPPASGPGAGGLDLPIFATGKERAALALFLVALFCLPQLASAYWLDVLCRIGVAIIAAMGLNLLTGYTGQISLGNAAFLAVGGYSTAVLAGRFDLPLYVVLPLSGTIAAVTGMLFGIPSLRLRGLYLAMATLAAHFIVTFVASHWDSVTGGVNGVAVPSARAFGFALEDDRHLFYLIYPVAVLLLFFARNLVRTRPGRAFIAIRDQDVSAAVLGIDVFRFKLLSFGVSSFYVGVAGSLLAYQARLISPENFPISVAIDQLGMIIVGGLGSVLGSILGACVITLLPELLRLGSSALAGHYPGMVELFASLKMGVFGLTIILFLVFEPEGLAARWRSLRNWRKLPDGSASQRSTP